MLFGGRDAENLGDTWVFDTEMGAWHEVTANPAPEARFSMGATYDAVRQRVLIFGGEGAGLYNDVWAFDVNTETWSQLPVGGNLPPARYGTSAVLDTVNDRLIISHGFASGRFDDTHVLDLITNTWSQVTTDVYPLARCLHEAIYNPISGSMILYGGCSSGVGPCPQGDTWAFNAASNTWTELNPGNNDAAPAARSNPALIAADNGAVWVFGGKTSSGASNDLWLLDSVTGIWTPINAVNAPAARSSHDAAYDVTGGRIFVFGGRGDSGNMNDLWAYTPHQS